MSEKAHAADVDGEQGRDGGAKSFYKMAAVLDCFTRAKGQLSITDIVEKTGMPRTTIHRIVASLRDIGLIDQDGRRHDYRLGLKMFYYGSVVLANLDLNRHARPHVLQLHQITGEIVHLHMFDGSQMVCIEREEMGEARLTTLTTIEAAPTYCTGVGKAFLAFQDEMLIRRIAAEEGLRARTERTLTTIEALLADLEAVRERGYAIDDEENEIGIRSVGAPIRDSRGQVFASVSVSGPTERMPHSRITGLAPTVIQTADAISRELKRHDSR
ncbi:IclR family transcriptional regulator [Chelativorans sp. AA-79]|uniref:IclR family transcriptional regulator n=1 Tax=Chelativorans sp. AA-79 TaxID=3028735 RepID=UPI0023F67E60|nr:IclR family transcriptional regulator [Chelativorans sp. AA-79]WEX11023.1 IclR family transcriptional regulator [Chelativorans sp. AA-79]